MFYHLSVGDFMVINGDCMVIVWWFYGDCMVILWWFYGDSYGDLMGSNDSNEIYPSGKRLQKTMETSTTFIE